MLMIPTAYAKQLAIMFCQTELPDSVRSDLCASYKLVTDEREEMAEVYAFDGDDYKHERDSKRLSTQLHEIAEFMKDGRWHTLAEISAETGAPEPSVSAQLRNMRKPRFGSHVIEKEYIENGLYRCRLGIEYE